MVQPLWRTVWRFLEKLEIKPPYDPTIPLLGIYTKENKIENPHIPAVQQTCPEDTWPATYYRTAQTTRAPKPLPAAHPVPSRPHVPPVLRGNPQNTRDGQK